MGREKGKKVPESAIIYSLPEHWPGMEPGINSILLSISGA
jgi:hypothetical protein